MRHLIGHHVAVEVQSWGFDPDDVEKAKERVTPTGDFGNFVEERSSASTPATFFTVPPPYLAPVESDACSGESLSAQSGAAKDV